LPESPLEEAQLVELRADSALQPADRVGVDDTLSTGRAAEASSSPNMARRLPNVVICAATLWVRAVMTRSA
jgi:hypothetical protein